MIINGHDNLLRFAHKHPNHREITAQCKTIIREYIGDYGMPLGEIIFHALEMLEIEIPGSAFGTD